MEAAYQHGLRFAEYEHSFSDAELLEFAENEYPGNVDLQQQWIKGAKRKGASINRTVSSEG